MCANCNCSTSQFSHQFIRNVNSIGSRELKLLNALTLLCCPVFSSISLWMKSLCGPIPLSITFSCCLCVFLEKHHCQCKHSPKTAQRIFANFKTESHEFSNYDYTIAKQAVLWTLQGHSRKSTWKRDLEKELWTGFRHSLRKMKVAEGETAGRRHVICGFNWLMKDVQIWRTCFPWLFLGLVGRRSMRPCRLRKAQTQSVFLISTRHIERIRGAFCDDALYKLTLTLTLQILLICRMALVHSKNRQWCRFIWRLHHLTDFHVIFFLFLTIKSCLFPYTSITS